MPEEKLLQYEITRAIIGAAIEVHNVLGPGFLESVYEVALAHEFELRAIPFERQVALAVSYKGKAAGQYRADFVVSGNVIVELKAIKQLTGTEESQLLNYLKATQLRVGLLINFGGPRLEHRRRVL